MKKIIFLLTVFVTLLTVSVQAATLYTNKTEEIVTDGVTLIKEQRFFGDSAMNITLIKADLKNKNLSFDLLKNSGGSDKVDTVMNHAKGDSQTVVAINGDFFSAYKGNQNFSLGIEVKDGELLQSHINSDMAAGFFEDNKLSLSYIDFTMKISAPDGTEMPIAHINKPTDYYGAVLMYTPDFNGATSPHLPEGITAVTVVEDVVTAKGISMGGVIPIPENGYILAINDNMTPFLDSKFSIGDFVKTEISVNPSIEDVQTAFGGGTLLLKDGQKTQITHDVSGNHPRSIIGTNSDGTVIYMMTVDGRQSVSKGVSLSQLADICKEMGMVNAINLDGGGSTAMVGKTLKNNTLHTLNSPSETRKVINAPAITSNAESLAAVGVLCEVSEKSVLSGDSIKIKVTPYDKNYNPPSSVSGTLSWSVSDGKGTVKDNVYYPTGSGEATVTAYYNGKETDSFKINIIGEVTGIIAPEKIGSEAELSGKVKVFDEEGNTAVINDLSLLNPSRTSGLLNLSRNGAKRSIVITSSGAQASIAMPVTSDFLNRDREIGTTFNIYSSSEMNTLFDRVVYSNAMDILEKSDVSAVVGGDKPADLTPANSPVMAGNYIERSYSHSKIVSLQQKDGVISRGTQWEKLSTALNSSQKNVFVILDKEPSFASKIDKKAFYSMLSDSAKTKNVFVISSGGENFCRIEDGVRYITVANIRDESTIEKSVEKVCYLSFKITNDSATYVFKNLYD
ncbi:MAG: phosphodiester glycosidase family protein [Clostridia bacterium]|nr:phosphodiester glycosidase family protein [Clostridia bacterium]